MPFGKIVTRTLVLVLLCACSAEQPQTAAQTPPAAPPQPPPAAQAPSPVAAWLDCIECSAERLKALVALGDRAVPELRDALLKGPPPDRLNAQQQHLKTTYESAKKYEQRRKDRRVPYSEQEYLRRYMERFVLRYRGQAASGLGAIATPQAKNALTEALKAGLPDTLRIDVEQALKSGQKPIANPDAVSPSVSNPRPAKPIPKGA
jgi:hypothetical protein